MKRKLAILALVAMTTACSSLPQSREDALQVRATAYYGALTQQMYGDAYNFFTPAYRSSRSLQEHYQRHPPIGEFLSADIEEIRCVSEHACDVIVNGRFRFAKGIQPVGGTEVPMNLVERWVNIDGEWFLLRRR